MSAMSKHESVKKAAFVCVILILVLGMMISGLRMLESTVFFANPEPAQTAERKTIVRDGIAYYPRQDLTTILLMGIDQTGPVKDSGSYTNHGASDAIVLVICDESIKQISLLALNRDTMLDMPRLGVDGRKVGTVHQQLALAHTYGSGLEDSCENVRETVSDFLGNIEIDYYLSANMDAIKIMNDAVGGVTVTIEDDFSQVDETLTMGEVTLMGDQAISFVRSRKDVGNQLNISRMKRQEAYVEGFADALKYKMNTDEAFALSSYEAVEPYVVTDISMNTFTSFMNRYADYEFAQIISPEGENILGEEFYEFHVDEEKLDQLVMELFYKEK